MTGALKPLKSQLGHLVADTTAGDELQRQAWHRHGWLKVSPGDGDLRPDQAAVIDQIGVQRFGPRRMADT